MKKILVSFFVILSAISVSFATLRFIPLEEAVKENDLIIIGTLKDIFESSYGMENKGTGRILVEQFIAGNVKTIGGNSLKSGDELRLDYVEDFSCVMGSHKRIENRQGIFLLKVNSDGEIESKDFRYLNDLAEINKILEKENKISHPSKVVKMYGELKSKDQSLISAIFAALISILLYHLLYRSKFRIR